MTEENNKKDTLHCAAAEGDIYKLNRLLRMGKDKNEQDESDNSPLHLAAFEDRPLAALVLVKAGAKEDLLNFRQETPLNTAINEHGKESVIALFLQKVWDRAPKTNQEKADELLRELEWQELMDSPLHGEAIRKLLLTIGIAG